MTARLPNPRPNVAQINALKTHCANGHEYTEASTYRYEVNGKPCRQCRICRAASRALRRPQSIGALPKATLTPAQVARLRDAVADGEATRVELMARFDITRAEYDNYTQHNEARAEP